MAGKWTTFRLGDVCKKIGSGATPRGGSSVYLDQGEFSLIRSQNIYNHGFHHDGLAYLTEQQAEDLSNVEVHKDDVLLNITGDSVARSCQVDSDVLPARVNQHVAIIRPEPKTLAPRFLRYYLVSPAMQSRMLSLAGAGATRNALTKGMIEAFEVSAPADVVEQQAIACILGALEDKIELNRLRNCTLEATVRAIFQSWFGNFDPVRAKVDGCEPKGLSKELAELFPDTFEDSVLGDIPKGWSACRWGDIVTLEYGKSLRNYAESIGSYRVFGTNGPIGWHTDALCDGPGIIVGRKGAYRGIHYSPKPFFVIDTAFYLKPKATLDLKWAYYELLKCDINRMDSGSAIPSTSRADFYAIPVCLPSPGVLHAFGRVTQPIYDRRDADESENVKLAALRDALLPKLISGELRVPDAERIVGRAL